MGLTLVAMACMIWHFVKWQKKVMLVLNGVQAQLNSQHLALQTQLQDQSFSQQRLQEALEAKILEELYEQCHVLSQFFQPANMQVALGRVVHELEECFRGMMVHLDPNIPSSSDGQSTADDVKTVRKQMMDVMSQLAALHQVSQEVSAVHKMLNTGDLSKLSVIVNKVTETHGQLLQLNGTAASKQDVQDTVDRFQNLNDRKLEEMLEKTAVLRVVVEQQKEKILGNLKDGHGWIIKNITDCHSLIRGQGGVIAMQKSLQDMVHAGRERQGAQAAEGPAWDSSGAGDAGVRSEDCVSQYGLLGLQEGVGAGHAAGGPVRSIKAGV